MIQRLAKVFTTLSNVLNNLAKKIAIALIGILVVLVLVTVFFRYVLSIGIGWSDEVARYLNIWAALLGASIAFKYGDHVGVEFFRNFLPGKASRIFKFLINILILVFLFVAEYYCYTYFMRSRSVTPSLQIPYRWIQLSLLIGLSIMSFHLLSFLFTDLHNFLSGDFSSHEKESPIKLRRDIQ